MKQVFHESRSLLNTLAEKLETELSADALAVLGPIVPGADQKVRTAIEATPSRRKKLAVLLHTGGGVLEVAERMVNVMRHHYEEVVFVIPDVAMSAGTVLAMSGDAILMNYFSCLGPIDPQIERDNKLVPALSYLIQYERLMAKSSQGTLTNAEAALLMNKFDLAELHQYEQARELSVSLLVNWLARYKFKDWNETEGQKKLVGAPEREARAREIAQALSDPSRWHSHARGIPMRVLIDELKLKIDDFGTNKPLEQAINDYFSYMIDFMSLQKWSHLVHTKHHF